MTPKGVRKRYPPKFRRLDSEGEARRARVLEAPGSRAALAGRFSGSLAAAVALALAAACRLYHLDYGLPEVVYVDAIKFVDEAAAMVAAGRLEPQQYQYPGAFANLLALIYYLGGITSRYSQHWTGHAVSAVSGILLTGVTFLIARTVTGNLGSFAAALFGAFCLTSVTESRIPAPDATMVLLMSISLLLLLWSEPTTLRFVFAGALAGIAVGCKWTAVYLLPWMAGAAWFLAADRSMMNFLRRTAFAFASCLAAFLASAPMFLFRPDRFLERLVTELEIQRHGQVGRVQSGYIDYWISTTPTWEQPWLGTSFLTNQGWLLTVLVLAALGLGLSGRKGRKLTFLAACAAVYLLLVSGPGRLKAFRFLLPILPVLYVATGWFIETVLLARVRRYRTAAGVVVIAALAIFPARLTLEYLQRTRARLTNEDAREWMGRNLPPGTRVFASPFFTSDLQALPLDVVFLPNAGPRQYRVPGNPRFNGEYDPLFVPDLVARFRAEDIRYVVVNSYFNDAFSPVPENLEYFPRSVEGYRGFMQRLGSESEVVFEVTGWSTGRLGPDITVYRLK